MLGLDPARWTMRRLDAAVRARQVDRWNHTAMLCWLLAEMHRDRKRSEATRFQDWHPLLRAEEREANKPPRAVMSREWVREQAREHYRRKGEPIPPELTDE